MADAHVLKISEIPRIARGSGVETVPLVSSKIGSAALSTGLTQFPEGGAIPFHSHNVEEQVTILEGHGLAVIDGRETEVNQWDTTFVPAGINHRFINRGPGRMTIMWVYAGTKVTRTFADSGVTVEQLSEHDKAE